MDEPEGVLDSLVEPLVGALAQTAKASGVATRRAVLHVVNSVARLAKTRDENGWPQVSVAYVVEGCGVGAGTARAALNAVCAALDCRRTRRGFLTVTPEARAACMRLTQRVDVPRPDVHRDTWGGRVVTLDTPHARGVTSCPCGHHTHGDRNPSLAYDLERGFATCQKTRAVYRLQPDGAWVEVRAPWSDRGPRPDESGTVDNTCPMGAPGQGQGASYPVHTGRNAWGRHLSASLTHEGLRRAEAGTRAKPREIADVMRWSDRQYGGEAEHEKAIVCAASGVTRPDRLVSLDRWILDADATIWGGSDERGWFPRVPRWRSVGTNLVAFDLDGLDDAPTDVDEAAVRRIRRAMSASPFELVSIVATSRTGVQVIARLAGWAPDTTALHRHLPTRRALMATGDRLLRALRRGGFVDRSSWAPGRYVRRPGWRVKNGEPVRARLWWAATTG